MSGSTSAAVSVIIASAQSVAKVYVIGAVGYCAVKFPRKAPLLPAKAVSTVARFSFHVLVIPLIYSTIANSVTASTIGSYWSVLVAAFCVLGISYVTATVLAIPFQLEKQDLLTLRISATWPNIVALPILIFPSLCEYRVVYEGFAASTTASGSSNGEEEEDKADLYQSCVANSNTLIFLYFLGWSLTFWSLGYRNLMSAANINNNNTTRQREEEPPSLSMCKTLWRGVQQTCLSPGFVAMVLGFITACIPPLQQALFDPGGYLRFLGAALQTLGVASSPISTMVVAASLVPQDEEHQHHHDDDNNDDNETDTATESAILAVDTESIGDGGNGGGGDEETSESDETSHSDGTSKEITHADDACDEEEGGIASPTTASSWHSQDIESPHEQRHQHADRQTASHDETDDDTHYEPLVMSDPNFGPHQLRRRSSIARFRQSIHHHSQRITPSPRPTTRSRRHSCEMRKLFLWFTLSRLVVTPAICVSIIAALDHANLWPGPDLSKLVIIINSALPGALIVVVLLKSQPQLSDSASVVAKVYLPSYLLSIVTIAGWTALGLWISLPETVD